MRQRLVFSPCHRESSESEKGFFFLLFFCSSLPPFSRERDRDSAAATYNRHGSAHCDEGRSGVERGGEGGVRKGGKEVCCKQSFCDGERESEFFLRRSHSFVSSSTAPSFLLRSRTKGAPPFFPFRSLPLEAPRQALSFSLRSAAYIL